MLAFIKLNFLKVLLATCMAITLNNLYDFYKLLESTSSKLLYSVFENAIFRKIDILST